MEPIVELKKRKTISGNKTLNSKKKKHNLALTKISTHEIHPKGKGNVFPELEHTKY